MKSASLTAAFFALTTLTPHSAQAKEGAEALLDKAEVIAEKVSKLRGLALKKEIKRGVMTKVQIKERLLERIDEEYTAKQIRAEEYGLKRLGLFPEEKDYLETVVGLMTNEIAGFYDPKAKELYIASEMGFGEDVVMSHEIDHAIQDQHYDLNRFLTLHKDDNDRVAARQALLEGDGTVLMMEFTGALKFKNGMPAMIDTLAQSMSSATMSTMAKYPLVLRESMIFPYRDGMKFVAYFRAKGGWASVDKLYSEANAPRSTEDILHPELFEKGNKPIQIKAKLPKAWKTWTTVQDNTIGEFGWRVFLQEHDVDLKTATQASSGWGGDRMVILAADAEEKNSANMVGLIATEWDSENDAKEFFDAATLALPSLTGTTGVRVSASSIQHRHKNRGGTTELRRDERRVTLVIGAPPAQAKTLSKTLQGWF